MEPSLSIQSAFEDTPQVPLTPSERELYQKAKIAYEEGKTPEDVRNETLLSMKAVLIKAIKETSLVLIQNCRDRLKKQYKLAQEEMEKIQQKGR